MNTIQNDTQITQLLTTILEKEEAEEGVEGEEEQYTIEVLPFPLPQPYSNILWNLCLIIQSGICMYIVVLGFIGGIIYLCVDMYKTS